MDGANSATPTEAAASHQEAIQATAEPQQQQQQQTENGTGGDDNDSSGDEGTPNGAAGGSAGGKKKKKNNKKKKKKPASKAVQSDPPRVGLTQFFAPDGFPVGATEPYAQDWNLHRTTSEECRAKERAGLNNPESEFNYGSLRRAAEVHKQVRAYAKRQIQPGMKMTDIANLIEDASRALSDHDPENPIAAGIGFPTGLSLNHCAAHYTPNPGDKKVLQHGDIMKVDIGVQVNGRIVDSAFTLSWNPDYQNLLEAVREATNTGVKTAGIDVRVADIGAAVEEVMSSYEVEVPGVNGGRPIQVKPIRNLTGHNIKPYSIHGGKSVPIIRDFDDTDKMEENELFAIETFGSTGRGVVRDSTDEPCSHFARKTHYERKTLNLGLARQLLGTINREFGTLPFCRRYLERIGETKHLLALRSLVENGIVQDYPPLDDIPGCQTAQFEHTILLRPTCKEIVSRQAVDPDY